MNFENQFRTTQGCSYFPMKRRFIMKTTVEKNGKLILAEAYKAKLMKETLRYIWANPKKSLGVVYNEFFVNRRYKNSNVEPLLKAYWEDVMTEYRLIKSELHTMVHLLEEKGLVSDSAQVEAVEQFEGRASIGLVKNFGPFHWLVMREVARIYSIQKKKAEIVSRAKKTQPKVVAHFESNNTVGEPGEPTVVAESKKDESVKLSSDEGSKVSQPVKVVAKFQKPPQPIPYFAEKGYTGNSLASKLNSLNISGKK